VTQQTPTQLDTSTLNLEEFAAKAGSKVELDIDDAPFLVDDEPSPVDKPAEQTPPPPSDGQNEEARLAVLRRRKRIILGCAILAVLALAGGAVWFFALREAPEGEPARSSTVVVVPSPESLAGPTVLLLTFEPFWVPQKDEQGNEHFLSISFSSETTDERLLKEVTDKKLTLRDAVYYYLRNKPHEYVMDSDNLLIVKQDLLDIINGYLLQGKLEDLFVENLILK
jgi:flagellar FliL protein